MRKWLVGLMAVWAGMAFAATPKQAVLDVEKMTCPACGITIEKALDKVPGVTGTKCDTKAATVTVIFDAERTTVSAVASAITAAGFPAKVSTNGG